MGAPVRGGFARKRGSVTMDRLTSGLKEAWATGDERLGKHWPIWVLALVFYAVVALFILTRVRIPSQMHLMVFIMATAVLSVTAIKIEWGILTLAVIMPFARPGITIGPYDGFQISGFNFALLGVAMAYIFRYIADGQFASLGPMLRRTRIDRNLFALGFVILISCLWSFNVNALTRITLTTGVYLKEQILYFVWFYLLVTLIRTPGDLRRFVMFFAVAGLLASIFGMITRLMGGAEAITPATMGESMGGGAGGRMEGGWFGLGHPNMFAAMLLMTMPLWFFAVGHLKYGFRRFMAEVAVINGFLGLLFTYSRSAWVGSVLGVGLVGLADKASLRRVILFGAIFLIAAQTVVLFTIDMNLLEIVATRFMDLQETAFSARPYIYESAFAVIREHPLLGVGLGAFQEYAPAIPLGWVPSHAHNVFLAYAAEAGLPAALILALLLLRLMWMSVRNLMAMGRMPGYGFIALGSCGALLGLIAQMMVVQLFSHRILGFGLYSLAAVIVSLDRMIRDGDFERLQEEAGEDKGGAWIA